MATEVKIPTWLQRDVWSCHVPTKTVFQPAQCLRKGDALFLADCNGTLYSIKECDKLCLDHLTGVALVVWQETPLTLTREGHLLTLTDGRRRYHIAVPEDKALEASKSLAEAFQGAIVDGSDYSPGLWEEFPAEEVDDAAA